MSCKRITTRTVVALWTLENTIMPDGSEELTVTARVSYGRGDVVCPKPFPQDLESPGFFQCPLKPLMREEAVNEANLFFVSLCTFRVWCEGSPLNSVQAFWAIGHMLRPGEISVRVKKHVTTVIHFCIINLQLTNFATKYFDSNF